MNTLRGTTGADFEAQGRLHRGVEGFGCFCCGQTEVNADRLIMIKGPFCFVYTSEDAPSPKYAIGLQYMKTERKSASHGRYPVLLVDNLGDVQYEFSFDTEETAKKFSIAVKEQAAVAQTEEVRKRLGHEHLMVKRSSVRYAESIAKKKVKDQPDKPISTEEIVNNMPLAPM